MCFPVSCHCLQYLSAEYLLYTWAPTDDLGSHNTISISGVHSPILLSWVFPGLRSVVEEWLSTWGDLESKLSSLEANQCVFPAVSFLPCDPWTCRHHWSAARRISWAISIAGVTELTQVQTGSPKERPVIFRSDWALLQRLITRQVLLKHFLG